MKRKLNPLVLILSGIIITVFIASSLVIALFSPELLPFSADAQSEATTEIFAMDTYITMTAYGCGNCVIRCGRQADRIGTVMVGNRPGQ